ncbi:hypothetical protein CI109_100439 [Kwoniella shandongensis]|uniref:Uncharacterized protein n=1 Tax=Kwoniella shandongensis TaxID=1734106 RepID=A0A5M6C3R3_9TREE|nr:uncharacterized protein CI109_001717 [Kwoniella shandongensis]KAA5529778.1 hypothetical protein CI109_001717 [Kwoniella shandongensis]
MPDLKTYLAANYMSGAKADAILARSSDPTIKKKRKKVKNEDYIGGAPVKGESSSGILLKDEDEEWRRRQDEDDPEDDDVPVVGKDVATFQKSKSAWATVASTSLPIPAGSNAAAGPSSPPPDIKPDPDAPPPPLVQLTKRRGGLRTAAEMREEAERAAAARSPSPAPEEDRPDPTATVHRDATGRVIDIVQMREEARKAEEEEKRKEAERKEWTKGLVQRQNREERAKMEREMGQSDVARRSDDAAMNREMREVERWNDPAASFLTKKKSKGPKKPKYERSWAPNRFMIPPGYRWDGVDRSNGFEKKFFQAQNTAARRTYEHNQWSVEDM